MHRKNKKKKTRRILVAKAIRRIKARRAAPRGIQETNIRANIAVRIRARAKIKANVSTKASKLETRVDRRAASRAGRASPEGQSREASKVNLVRSHRALAAGLEARAAPSRAAKATTKRRNVALRAARAATRAGRVRRVVRAAGVRPRRVIAKTNPGTKVHMAARAEATAADGTSKNG
jgi:hypothetical protein